jgi:preprotein translocase subunit SecF
MDAQNSSKAQENEGDQQPSQLPILSEKDKLQETSDHVSPLVSETIRHQMFLLIIAALPFPAGSRY